MIPVAVRAVAALLPLLLAAPSIAAPDPLGPPVDLDRWRYMRRLGEPPREGLYGVVLDATDLGALRPDLGDLRVADSRGRQVPYLIEADRDAQGRPRRRIVFRLSPALGPVRLFLGNAAAEPPRYPAAQLAGLRRAAQERAPAPLLCGPLQANNAYRPRAGDYVRAAMPAKLQWATLLLSLAALLALTVRLIKKRGP